MSESEKRYIRVKEEDLKQSCNTMNTSSDKKIDDHFSYKNDIKYQKLSINNILDESIEKGKISMLMPRFMENLKEVYSRLKNTEFVKCAKILRAYLRDEKATIKGDSQRAAPTQYQEQSLIRLIDVFQENYKLLSYFPDWIQDLTKAQRTTLDELALINSTARGHFEDGAVETLKEEGVLHVIYNERREVMQGLKNIENILRRNRATVAVIQRRALLSLHDDLHKQQVKAMEIRKTEKTNCMKQLNPRNFTDREDQVKAYLEEAMSDFEKSQQAHRDKEEVARAERDKIQLQYKALLKKYDDVMSEKFHEQLYLDSDFDRMKMEFEQFVKRVYEPAEQIYINVVKVREWEEERIWQAKVRAFTENRAARIIQLWYRNYLRDYKPYLVPKAIPSKDKKQSKKGKKKTF